MFELIKGDTKRVTRTCDDCGNKKVCYKASLLVSRKKRQDNKDYCKACGYSHRTLQQQKGDQSPFWKGGKWINDNGYIRMYMYDDNGCKKSYYEHKYIYGQHVGREISRKEQIHHIDLNKLNNSITNLFLCRDKRHHHSIHHQMETLGYQLLNKNIWFDRGNKRYIVEFVDCPVFSPYSGDDLILSKEKDNNNKFYVNVYLGNRQHQRLHRYLMEKELKRKLRTDEHVHHIDGDPYNNSMDNLVLLTRKEHKGSHDSLQRCVAQLFKDGYVRFEDGQYKIGGAE